MIMSTELDPRRLLIFREVARHGSLSGAATALGWTQPAVGQHMQRLERDVGIPLIHRSVRGITLTEAGTALLAHADAIASRLSAAQSELQAFASLEAGSLSLVAFPSAAAVLVPPALAVLESRAPALDVRLTTAEPAEALALVTSGDADLAVVFAYGETADNELIALPLFEDPVRVVLPKDHRLARRGRSVVLSDLSGERWVAGEDLLAITSAAGFAADVRHRTDDYVVAQRLVAEGLVVTLLPGLALAAAPDKGVVALPVRGKAPQRQVSLLLRAELMESPAVVAGIEVLREVAAGLS